MRYLSLIFIITILTCSCNNEKPSEVQIDPNEISFEKLTDKNGIDLSHSELDDPIVYFEGKPLNGICFERYEDGIIGGQTEYKNGKFNGFRKFFDPSGLLWMEEHYLLGKLHGKKTIYYNGTKKIWEVWNYENGELNGEHVSYTESGSVRCKATFNHGSLSESHGDCPFDK